MPLQLHQRIELFLANRRSRSSLRHSGRSHSRRFGISDEPPVLRHPHCLPQRQPPLHLPGGFAGISGHTAFAVAGILQFRVILLMRPPRTIRSLLFLLGILLLASNIVLAQQIVDRIVARVENDVILLSDVRLLARYQLLVDGKSESDAQILDRLVDQWIVRNEATVARTPRPSEPDIQRGTQRLLQSFASNDDYQARRKLAGLSEAEVTQLTAEQIYLDNYLDSRFRPSAQVDEAAIQDFYQTAVVPRAKARNQNPPTLDAAHDYIQEALIQRGIDEQAGRWLQESHSRIRAS